MDVNLPYLGSSESTGPSVESINMVAEIGVLVATVPVTVPIQTSESVDHFANVHVGGEATELDISIGLTNNTDVRYEGPDFTMSGETSERDNISPLVVAGEALQSLEPNDPTPIIVAGTHEVHVDLDIEN